MRTRESNTSCTSLALDRPSEALSYIRCQSDNPLIDRSVGDLLTDNATFYPDKEALFVPFQRIRLTYSQLKLEVDDFAVGLIALGLNRGDRLAIWSHNTYQSYITSLAAWRAGLILVPLNAAYKKKELEFVLEKATVKCLVVAKSFRKQNFEEILKESFPHLLSGKEKDGREKCPALKLVITCDAEISKGALNFLEVSTIGADHRRKYGCQVLPFIKANETSAIFFTSGTTGSPKGAMLSQYSLVNNGRIVGQRVQLCSEDTICLPVPLFHVFGCQLGIFAALDAKAKVVLPSCGYDIKSIFTVVSQERCSVLVGTPTIFLDMLNSALKINFNAIDISGLKKGITGGAVCSRSLVRQLKDVFSIQEIYNNYGMTETGATLVSMDTEEEEDFMGGFPCEHAEVKIVNKRNEIVPVGYEGELIVRSYSTMIGYWDDLLETEKVVHTSGWFRTGDVFVMEESGQCRIVGRLKEMINRGGENIVPKEIEILLETHEDVVEAYVFGIPDARMGEVPVAWISLKSGVKIQAGEIKEFCRQKISYFKVPEYIFFQKEFPKNAMGKVQKFIMRNETLRMLEDHSSQWTR